MSTNASCSFNTTLVPPLLPSSFSLVYAECVKSTVVNVFYSIYTVISTFFLLPLCLLVLYFGFQHRHSTSHSDFFTYHIVAVEMLGCLGALVYTVGSYTTSDSMLLVGVYVFNVILPGQTLFHVLTCADRYLAAVHPVAYMRLRDSRGVRIRTVSAAGVWLTCFGWTGVIKWYMPGFPDIPMLCMLAISLSLIFFCCLSVLRVLTHSGPGEEGGDQQRVDQSKHRAFLIIRAIMGALLLRFAGLLTGFGLSFLQIAHLEVVCLILDFALFLSLPCSLVQPLLFLHKTGKLQCCRQINAEAN